LTLGWYPSIWDRARRSRSKELYLHPEGPHADQGPKLRTEVRKIRNYNINIHIIVLPFRHSRRAEEHSVRNAPIRQIRNSHQRGATSKKISLTVTIMINDDYNIYLGRY
jgi:hypothetical protein